jgi:hypothetical protein
VSLSRSEAARVASRARWADRPDPEQRRAELHKPQVAAAVRKVVDNWPELTPEQVTRLRSLLQPVGGEAA